MKRAPKNTTKEVQENPMGMIEQGMTAGMSSAIGNQESEGQSSFVGSDTLPVNIKEKDKALLEAAGVKFLEPVERDPIFQYVELPDGWTKEPTEHAMWSMLIDDQDRLRANIFYKAAFYDRSSHLTACSPPLQTLAERADNEKRVRELQGERE